MHSSPWDQLPGFVPGLGPKACPLLPRSQPSAHTCPLHSPWLQPGPHALPPSPTPITCSCSSVWLDSSSLLSGHRSQWLQDTPKHPSLLRGSLWGGILEVFPSPPEGTQKLHPNSPGLGNGRQGRVQLHMRAPCLMTPPRPPLLQMQHLCSPASNHPFSIMITSL